MAKTAFLPSLHGFHFRNDFPNIFLNTPFASLTGGGRCGGMAYASLDYFSHQTPVPNCISNSPLSAFQDFSASGGVPPDGTILADFILIRLMATFAQYGFTSFAWNSASDHATWIGPGRVAATKINEWPKLQAHLDNGAPVTIGLVSSTGSLGDAHQIVAYDYSLGPGPNGTQLITISVYDNNFPDNDNVTIQSTADLWTNPHWNEAISGVPAQNNGRPIIWSGWWVEDGAPASWWGVPPLMVQPIALALAGAVTDMIGISELAALFLASFTVPPPASEDALLNSVFQLLFSVIPGGQARPPLVDLVLAQPITPNPANEFLGETYQPAFTVMNQGPYPAHANFLQLLSGDNQLNALLQDPTSPLTLAAGQSFSPSIQCQIPAALNPGAFNLTAAYTTVQNESIVLPVAAGVVNQASLSVFPDPTVTISVLSEMQQENIQNSVITGGWNVVLQAVTPSAGFTPVSFKWIIDSGTQTAEGAIVSLFLPVGAVGQPLVYTHTILVTASNGQGESVSATYTLILQNTSSNSSVSARPTQQERRNNSSYRFRDKLGCDYRHHAVFGRRGTYRFGLLFDPVAVQWSPQPEGLNGSLTAVYSMDGSSLQVTATITDAIGQTLTRAVTLPGAIISNTYGPTYSFPASWADS